MDFQARAHVGGNVEKVVAVVGKTNRAFEDIGGA